MAIKRINGLHLEQMLRNGLANLQRSEEEINRLNVFPVADGDTGTNMRLTLQYGLQCARSSAEAGQFLKSLSDGMLLGARGNSGVILSQFFRGFYAELSRCSLIGPGELRNGLIRAYRTAYQAVIQPVEGTILSVAREGIEHIRTQIGRSTGIDTLLSMYVAEMRKTLALTPEMLSVLKEAGVVDSGAAGLILIFDGMLRYLRGETIDPGADAAQEADMGRATLNLDLFDENSRFIDGYCMEFILQLMLDPTYDQTFRQDRFIEALKELGESIVCVQDGKRVKVHIHTMAPARIITLAQRYGEFLTFKLDNMQIQHNEHDLLTKPAPHKALSVVAVVNGEEMRRLFTELGCDVVIDGGPTMNTSAQEFVSAFEQIDADAIVVLPNNKNVILAAEQAAGLVNGKNIIVLPSASYADGYFAIAMDMRDSEDTALRIAQMRRGIAGVVTLCQTTASRDYAYHEISCRKGEEIVLNNGQLVCVSDDWKSSVVEAMGMIEDMDDRETCVIFRGKGIPESAEDELAEVISSAFPLLEVQFVGGGQEIYHWVLGVM
ncbi:MAG: DAK2 domain-containing protein [Oscillospiraceae bacterium]|nr:DAK2 domain-containing protein [Oscillospiraceae bacterium]